MPCDGREVLQQARPAWNQLVVPHVIGLRGLQRLDAELGVAPQHVGAHGLVLLIQAHAAHLQPRETAHAAGDVLRLGGGQEPLEAAVHPLHARGAVLQRLINQVEGRGAAAHHQHVLAAQGGRFLQGAGVQLAQRHFVTSR
jgi:hypothetical protein